MTGTQRLSTFIAKLIEEKGSNLKGCLQNYSGSFAEGIHTAEDTGEEEKP